MANGGIVAWFLIFAFVSLMFIIGAIISSQFLGALFSNTSTNTILQPYSNTIISIGQNTFGLWDKSFVILLIVILLLDTLISYFNPSKIKAIVNFIFLFFFVAIFLVFKDVFTALNSALSFSKLMPVEYAVYTSYATALIFLVFIIINIGLNMREKTII